MKFGHVMADCFVLKKKNSRSSKLIALVNTSFFDFILTFECVQQRDKVSDEYTVSHLSWMVGCL